jgi:serine/threonine protein kinase
MKYIEKVGHALEYVHERHINHLDVKPANIMVRREDDEPILIDFGLSKQYDTEGNQTSTTPTGISHGYAPIEQYNAGGVKEFSPQADIYSLGATLYYLLSGVVPPQATSLVSDSLTFPKSISPSLVPAIDKAMSLGKKNRQASVQEFIDELLANASNYREKSSFESKPSSNESKSKSSRMNLSVLIYVAIGIAVICLCWNIGRGNHDEAVDADSVAADYDSVAVEECVVEEPVEEEVFYDSVAYDSIW